MLWLGWLVLGLWSVVGVGLLGRGWLIGESSALISRKKAKKCSAEKLLKKVNKKEEVLSRKEKIVEREKAELPKGLEWKVNAMTEVEVNERNKVSSFSKLEKILPVSNKPLKDARGFVIADYQNHLEKEWIETLKSQYNIKVNQGVFESLIRE